jgi:hypothetical protein
MEDALGCMNERGHVEIVGKGQGSLGRNAYNPVS